MQISIDGGGRKIPVDYFDAYRIDRSELQPVLFGFGKVTPKKGEKVKNTT